MSGPSIVTEQLASSRAQDGRSWGSTLSEYWALTKPEVNFLILITTGVGFYLGCGSEARPFSFAGLFNTLLGTLLVASGTGTLNQYIERTFDAQMRRTARRPAASGHRCYSAFECACDAHAGHLSVGVHTAETKNTVVRSRWRFSWCHASPDRLGRSIWPIE